MHRLPGVVKGVAVPVINAVASSVASWVAVLCSVPIDRGRLEGVVSACDRVSLPVVTSTVAELAVLKIVSAVASWVAMVCSVPNGVGRGRLEGVVSACDRVSLPVVTSTVAELAVLKIVSVVASWVAMVCSVPNGVGRGRLEGVVSACDRVSLPVVTSTVAELAVLKIVSVVASWVAMVCSVPNGVGRGRLEGVVSACDRVSLPVVTSTVAELAVLKIVSVVASWVVGPRSVRTSVDTSCKDTGLVALVVSSRPITFSSSVLRVPLAVVSWTGVDFSVSAGEIRGVSRVLSRCSGVARSVLGTVVRTASSSSVELNVECSCVDDKTGVSSRSVVFSGVTSPVVLAVVRGTVVTIASEPVPVTGAADSTVDPWRVEEVAVFVSTVAASDVTSNISGVLSVAVVFEPDAISSVVLAVVGTVRVVPCSSVLVCWMVVAVGSSVVFLVWDGVVGSDVMDSAVGLVGTVRVVPCSSVLVCWMVVAVGSSVVFLVRGGVVGSDVMDSTAGLVGTIEKREPEPGTEATTVDSPSHSSQNKAT